MSGKPLRATRPKHFFAKRGRMPESVALKLTIPRELGDREEILAEVRARVAAVELEEARKRAATGRKVLGRYAVQRQSGAIRRRAKSRDADCGPRLRREAYGLGSRRFSVSASSLPHTGSPGLRSSRAHRFRFRMARTGSRASPAWPSMVQKK